MIFSGPEYFFHERDSQEGVDVIVDHLDSPSTIEACQSVNFVASLSKVIHTLRSQLTTTVSLVLGLYVVCWHHENRIHQAYQQAYHRQFGVAQLMFVRIFVKIPVQQLL